MWPGWVQGNSNGPLVPMVRLVLYFQNGKRYHVENLHGSLFLRDILLDGDKTLRVLAIVRFWSMNFSDVT